MTKTDNNNDGIIDELGININGKPPAIVDNNVIATEGEDVYDFTENDPFSGGNY